MERRTFLSVLSGSLLAAPLAAQTQSPEGLPRIGYLCALRPEEWRSTSTFREELGELGYIEGRNIAVEERFAAGSPDRLVALARELVALKVAVIVAVALPAIQCRQRGDTDHPNCDGIQQRRPSKTRHRRQLGPSPRQRDRAAHYGAGPNSVAERLQLLKQVTPGAGRASAFFWNPLADHPAGSLWKDTEKSRREPCGSSCKMFKVKGPHGGVRGSVRRDGTNRPSGRAAGSLKLS